MDPKTVVLISGIAAMLWGFLLLSNESFAGFVSRTAGPGNENKVKADRRFQGWTGIVLGTFLIALWLLR